MECLVIVAHPDDETIWMGGLILRHPDWCWRIIALSRRDDPDRAPKFRLAAHVYGAESAISDLDDSPALASLSPDLSEIKDRISHQPSAVSRQHDLVFTHGPDGEYAHPRHRQVHRAVTEMIESGELHGTSVYFAYSDSQPLTDADIILHLTPDEYSSKQRVIRDIYGFGEDQFEVRSAGRIEAFRFGAENICGLKT